MYYVFIIIVGAYDWPKPDEMQQAFTQISDAYNDLVL